MKFQIVIIFMLGVLACAPRDVAAQGQSGQAAPPEPARFSTEIIVTPERGEAPRALVPAATVVVEGETLLSLPAAHPSEIVSFLPGFNVSRPQFYAGRPVVSVRGFFGGGEAEYTLLLVDGVPVADVESGLIDWSVLPASSIRRIEAFRGPGASLYGDSAVGGVIQILTDRLNSGGQLTTTGGSFGTVTGDGSYGRRRPTLGFRVSGAARRTDGAFDHSGGHQLLGTGSIDGQVRGFSWRGNITGDGEKRNDPGALSSDSLNQDPYASDPLHRFDTVDRRSFSTAFTLRNATLAWRPQARVNIAVRNEDLIRTILLAPGLGDRRARDLSSAAVSASLEGEHTFSAARPIVLRLGLDLSRAHLDTSYRSVSEAGVVGALNSEASGWRLRSGVFASSFWEPARRVRLSGAVRWDNVGDSEFGSASSAGSPHQRAWSPRAGIVVRLNDAGTVSLFSQVSKAFKVPTLDQLFDPRPYPDFRGGTFTISNRQLIPQRAMNIEGGISAGTRVRLSAVAYRMVVHDEIDFDVRRFSYANIGRSRHAGLEVEAEGRWWRRVQPSISYVLSRVVTSGDDRQLKNVPRHLFSATANLHFPSAVSAYVRYHHTRGAFLDDENKYAIDGPSTLDFRLSRPIGRHTIFVDGLNVTGNRYEEYGFTLTDFRGQVVPYAYPGAPRGVRVGLTLSF